MKNIKFKALDLDRNLVFRVSKLGFYNEFDKRFCEVIDHTGKYIRLHNFELLPFSNVYSCDGCEIYEGDIVEYACEYNCLKSDYNYIGYSEVVYSDGMFFLKEHPNERLSNVTILRHVGNIYENSQIFKCLDCEYCKDDYCEILKDDVIENQPISCMVAI